MSEQGATFRSAAFGGFNRSDVLDYIQKMTREHQEELDVLRKREQESLEALERARSMSRVTAVELEKRGETEQRLQEAEQRRDALEEENRRLTEENAQLRRQLEDWEPNVENYGAIKEQLAEIELDARSRSSRILSRADARVEETYRRANLVLQSAAHDFNSARAESAATLAYLRQELLRLEGELAALSDTLDHDSERLASLKAGEEENA